MKRVISLLLSAIMLLSLCAVAASAEGSTQNAGYYLVCPMTNWEIDSGYGYHMTLNTEADTEEYVLRNVAVTYLFPFRIVYSEDGAERNIWYPDGIGGETSIEEEGVYDIYLRPRADGGDNWIYGCIRYEKVSDINWDYYLTGHVTGWELTDSLIFKRTARADKEEYAIKNVFIKANDPIKAVYKERGRDDNAFWIPDGMGFYYNTPEDGVYDIYLYPRGDGECPEHIDNYWNNGYWDGFYIVDGPKAGDMLYLDKFKETYTLKYIASYQELYYHKDKDGETDWALIKTEPSPDSGFPEPIVSEIVGNRHVLEGMLIYPFVNNYGIYDVKEDKFESVIISSFSHEIADYEGLGRAYDEYGKGRLLGDIDRDDELTIIDCTLMQRCATRVRDWPEDDEIKAHILSAPQLKYYSDFDRNGERDIVDATKLQRYVTLID